MRCESCDALRWYGAQLQPIHAYDRNGNLYVAYYLCEACAEQRMIAFHCPEDGEHYAPTMHPPHMRRQ